MADDTKAEQGPPYEWSAFYDDDGNIYYYNSVTEESSWEAPEKYNPVPEEGLDAKEETPGNPWSVHMDDEGNEYYYNEVTEETTWEKPDGFEPGLKSPTAPKEDEDGEDAPKAPDETPVHQSPQMEDVTEEAALKQVKDSPPPKTDEDKKSVAKKEPETSDSTQKIHEWSAHYDDDGNLYYYNDVTEESTWDPPEHFNPPEDKGVEKTVDAPDEKLREEKMQSERAASEVAQWEAFKDDEGREYYYNARTGETVWERPSGAVVKEGIVQDKVQPSSEQKVNDRGAWVAYTDDEGREYFFNTVTEETTWDEPDGFVRESVAADDETTEHIGKDEKMSSPSMKPDEPEAVEKVVVDPAVERLRKAKEGLERPDAVMERDVMKNVTEVVTNDEGNPQNAVQALIESFHGQTAICGLLGQWFSDLGGVHESGTNSDSVRQLVQDVLVKMVRERFTKEGGDAILNLSRSEAAFLEDMIDSSRWRKMLIDLSAVNKDSALLMYCLQSISKRGHHREIAKRINQSDHFSVFNAMIASELKVVGKIAVSSCREGDMSIGLEALVSDLLRTCGSTSYTFLYTSEVIKHLIEVAKTHELCNEGSLFSRAVEKWQRLMEELRVFMIDPNSTTSSSSPLFRKRRLDVTLVLDEVHQRQRRRLASSEKSFPTVMIKRDDRQSKLETAMETFLRRFSIGTRIDDRVLDDMLPSDLGGDPSNTIGHLLLGHPLASKALLGYIYKPGIQRAQSIATRNKCARLVALTVVAAQADTNHSHPSLDLSPTDLDEVALTRLIAEGGQLCETLENMVSFLVTSTKSNGGGSTPGQKLCALSTKCGAIAQGVCMWANELTKGGEFVTSASYPTLSPSILSLLRRVIQTHPFANRDVTKLALRFLDHSNPDVSYQKMNEIKEQSLRLLLLICTTGDAPSVLSQFTELLNRQGTSGFDAALIRYFVAGLLDLVGAPLSMPFTRALVFLLKSPSCVAALRTNYFEGKSQHRLQELLTALQSSANLAGVSKEESTSIKAATALYSS